MNVNYSRCLIHTGHLIAIEVPLLHASSSSGQFAQERNAGSENSGSFELRTNPFRVDDQTRIDSDVYPRYAHFARRRYLDFNHRSDIRQEAPMRSNAERSAIAGLAVRPVRLLSHDIDNVSQSCRIERELRIHPGFGFKTFLAEVDHSGLPDKFVKIL